MDTVVTWPIQQWVSFSGWLADAYGVGFNLARTVFQGQRWNSETLVRFGQALSKGYGPGL